MALRWGWVKRSSEERKNHGAADHGETGANAVAKSPGGRAGENADNIDQIDDGYAVT